MKIPLVITGLRAACLAPRTVWHWTSWTGSSPAQFQCFVWMSAGHLDHLVCPPKCIESLLCDCSLQLQVHLIKWSMVVCHKSIFGRRPPLKKQWDPLHKASQSKWAELILLPFVACDLNISKQKCLETFHLYEVKFCLALMKRWQNPPLQVNSRLLFLSHLTLTVAFFSFSSNNTCDHVLFRPAEKESNWSFLKVHHQEFRLEISALHLLCQGENPNCTFLRSS